MTKEGQPPRVLGIHLPGPSVVEVFPNVDGSGISVDAANPSDEESWIESVRNRTGESSLSHGLKVQTKG
jgi:hypothetical protein